jgi:UDP-3-O-[3-hydroxymyristoyl] glucosamine N-acyltransferase
MQDLLIVGAGGFAELARYYFTREGGLRVVAHVAESGPMGSVAGVPVLDPEQAARAFPAGDHGVFVALEDNRERGRAMAAMRARGYELASHVSPKARVGRDLELRPNVMLMERVGIHPFVEIGEGTIVWSGARIGFHGSFGCCCWIEGALLGESVRVGDRTSIGINATILPFLEIGPDNRVGPATVVTGDTGPGEVHDRPPTAATPGIR